MAAAAAEARRATTPVGTTASASLLQGEVDEEAERAAFQAAVMAWRGGGKGAAAASASPSHSSAESASGRWFLTRFPSSAHKFSVPQRQLPPRINTDCCLAILCALHFWRQQCAVLLLVPLSLERPTVCAAGIEAVDGGGSGSGGRLLAGTVDEDAEHRAFRAAVDSWRGAGAKGSDGKASCFNCYVLFFKVRACGCARITCFCPSLPAVRGRVALPRWGMPASHWKVCCVWVLFALVSG